jgi:DNA-binding IclR family transcriptional regulator
LTAFFSVRDGDQARCLGRADRGEIWIATYALGSTLPLTVGAGPMALLAQCSDDEIDQLLKMPRPRLTLMTVDDPRSKL